MDQDNFFRNLLPLHEKRIEETLTQSNVDLEEFLDYTQIRLNHFIATDIDLKARGITMSFMDHTKCILDTKKVQAVIIQMLEGSNTEAIELKGLCLFLLHRTGFNAPGKNDTLKWEAVLKEYQFKGKFKASSIGKIYNTLNRSEERSLLNDKHYKQAVLLFNTFPDDKGLKKLKSAMEQKIK